MTDQPRPPLWREMNAAQMALGYPLPQEMAYSDAISAMHMIRAAEIRAVADEVGERFRLPTPETFVNLDTILYWLRNEARRAEVGE